MSILSRALRFSSSRVRESWGRRLQRRTRWHSSLPQAGTFLWIIAAVLVIAGIVSIVRGQMVAGIILIVLGLLVGPGGVSIFD
jgi:hypothetical protein